MHSLFVALAHYLSYCPLSWIIGGSGKCHFPRLDELRSCRNPLASLLLVDLNVFQLLYSYIKSEIAQQRDKN
jgi:hypothetical protein